jgi:hypothetical protein
MSISLGAPRWLLPLLAFTDVNVPWETAGSGMLTAYFVLHALSMLNIQGDHLMGCVSRCLSDSALISGGLLAICFMHSAHGTL